ncbi:MAG: ATP phosphoribosyltransferase regulatory subunit [Elainellaceae cyanobacterium]
MVHQLPMGARDLLPLDVAQKQWIKRRLQQRFERWGYHRIITPTLEKLETLTAGGAVNPSTVMQLHDADNEVLGLRPELTASVARAAAARMDGVSLPQRLYYSANVFRRLGHDSSYHQHEFYQAGVEMVGSGGVVADAEMLLLLTDCLHTLGLTDWHLIVGEAALTRSLLQAFPPSHQDEILQAFAAVDRVALETMPLSPDLRSHALTLFDLRGRQPEDVIQQLGQLDLNGAQRNLVNRLKVLFGLLGDAWQHQRQAESSLSQVSRPPIVLDLSLIQTFDYYSGIVFDVVLTGESGHQRLGQGGRYDHLLGVYHPEGLSYPGVGFVLNVDELHQSLLRTGQLPISTPASNWLVVPKTPEAHGAAFAYAQTIRESAALIRVEVDLSDRGSLEKARQYARERRIEQLAWIDEAGTPTVERLT